MTTIVGNMTWEDIEARRDSNGRIKVVFKIPMGQLACVSGDYTYNGLNEWIDDNVFNNSNYFGSVMDINYQVVGFIPANNLEATGYVLIEVDADASEIEKVDDDD